MPENERRLPIKVVIPQDSDLRKPPAGGDKPRTFGKVDRSVREALVGQIREVGQQFRHAFERTRNLPGVARVVLKKLALAKSYRPTTLFSPSSCPIIGGEDFGRILVSVGRKGLDRLVSDVVSRKGNQWVADLSTIERIEAYTAEDAAGSLGVRGLTELVLNERIDNLKLRLFSHPGQAVNDTVHEAFVQHVRSLKLPDPEPLDYASGIHIFRVGQVSPQVVEQLAGFVGVQSISPFAEYRLVSQSLPRRPAREEDFPPPMANQSYPTVGLIDSGTNPDNALLSAWVKDRDEEDVPRAVQNNNHGSFVAGLLANARRFNHDDLRFPNTPARIVDVVAMPADAGITEDDLLDIIRRALTKYPKVRVWNLSISNVSSVCQNDAFSDFAMVLDELQDKHKVTFVICAGNYVCQPLRGWPPGDLGEGDRIFPPADSVRALTVGSLAHYHQADSRVKSGEPSPFSRCGPGPAFIPKPEVCHYGGNCTADLDFSQVGILSVDAGGNVAEDIGTSFSTPIVASLLAHVYEGVADPVSTNLAKALVVHSAALQSDSVDARTLKYRGFGVPREVADMLTCTPWQATLVFQPQLPPDRRIFNPRIDFPIPKCFRRADGKVEGEFLMTLVYDPPLGRGAGAEYCRVNVDVSLGTYEIRSRSGKREHKGLIPPEPADVGKLYEEYQVKHGFKWSPVKVYRKRLCRVEGKAWRLQIRVLYRDKQDLRRPQNVALVLTMFDPTRQKPVYDDVVASMRQLGWVTQDLRVHGRVRGIIR